jgi:purine-cytosine permease-like protein
MSATVLFIEFGILVAGGSGCCMAYTSRVKILVWPLCVRTGYRQSIKEAGEFTLNGDRAREVRQPRTALTAILVGTIIADVSLMTIGFLYPEFTSRLIGETSEKGIFGVLAATFVIIALWSTNDSNFYSTEKALHNLGVPTMLTAGLVVVATAAVGVLIGDRFFSVIAPWLQAMGWIGIPLGLFWLLSYFKQRGNWKRDGG